MELRRAEEQAMMEDLDLLLRRGIKQRFAAAAAKVDMEIVKQKISSTFVKGGLTAADVKKMQTGKVDIQLDKLIE